MLPQYLHHRTHLGIIMLVLWIFLLNGCAAVALIGVALTPEPKKYAKLEAMPGGHGMGRLDVEEEIGIRKLSAKLSGLRPGQNYALEIHELGKCSDLSTLTYIPGNLTKRTQYDSTEALIHKITADSMGRAFSEFSHINFAKFTASFKLLEGNPITLRLCDGGEPDSHCADPPVACGIVDYDGPPKRGWKM